jgi:CheY-like chemotaxis protein
MRCRQLGVKAYLTKPVRQSVLLDAVLAVLHGTDTAMEDFPLVTRHTIGEMQRGLNVLLAEDNAVNARLVMATLLKHGHNVQMVENGRQAVDAALKGEFDVVLMDVQMPEMDGMEATAAIRSTEAGSDRHLPIVALTAHAMTGDKEACLKAGMDYYLSKPIHVKELLALLEGISSGRARPNAGASEPPVADSNFDLDEVLKRVEGDRALLGELIGIFRSESPRMLEEIRRFAEEKDERGLQRSAHALKGAAGNLSAKKTSGVALALEMLAREGDLTAALDKVGELESAMQQLDRDLTRHLQSSVM